MKQVLQDFLKIFLSRKDIILRRSGIRIIAAASSRPSTDARRLIKFRESSTGANEFSNEHPLNSLTVSRRGHPGIIPHPFEIISLVSVHR